MLIKFLEQIGIAYIFGALAFGGWIWTTLSDVEVTQDDGRPMPKKYFFITAALWPLSIYLIIKEWNHDGTS